MKKSKNKKYFFPIILTQRAVSKLFRPAKKIVDWATLPKLLTLRQVAEILHVHPNTLRLWDNQRHLRAIRLGTRRDRRYERDEVREIWLTRQQTPAEEFIQRWSAQRNILNQLRQRYARPVGVISALVVAMLAISSSQFAVADTTTSTITVQSKNCVGWQESDRAQEITLGEATQFSDFTTKNSAHYQSSLGRVSDDQQDAVASGTFDAPSTTITCSGFDLTGLAAGSTISHPELVISFGSQAATASTGGFIVETTVDGDRWVPLTLLPVQSEKFNQQTFGLAADVTKEQLAQLQVRIRPDVEIDTPTINAFLDGMALQVTAVIPVETNPQKNSRAKNDLKKLVDFSQETYAVTEQPLITVPKKVTKKFLFVPIKTLDWSLKDVQLVNSDSETSKPEYTTTEGTDGGDTITEVHFKTAHLQPGKYRVLVTMRNSEGGQATVEKEFLWGVMAVNFDRPNPRPNDVVTTAIGVLDDEGKTICNALIDAKVTDPRGKKTTFSVKANSVIRSKDCVDKSITNEPDYHFQFTTKLSGTYHITVVASTIYGERKIEENLVVDKSSQFAFQRSEYSSRINPLAAYPSTITITPLRDYKGVITERVPKDFSITKLLPTGTILSVGEADEPQKIQWSVDWKAGQTYYLRYTYNAPDISPALFRVGPMSIDSPSGSNWRESRQWQIASDAISSVTWDGSASNLWSNAANWSTNAIPQAGDNLVFPAGASNKSNQNDLGENYRLNSITFDDSGYTLSGNTIILGQGQNANSIILPGITDSVSSGGNTISLPIRLDATRLISVSNSGETLTISGAITGVGGLSKEGTGTLVLSGGNTFGGVTKVNGGVLSCRHATCLGTIVLGTEVVGNAALELQGTIAIGREPLLLRAYGVSNGGALRNVLNNNSFDGLITIAGTTEIASDSGTLTLNGGVTGTFNLNLDGAGDITFAKAPITTSSGLFTKNGAGTVTLNFPNTNNGLTTVNAGTLLYGVDNAIFTGAITVNGGTLDIATYSDMVGTVTLGTLAGGTGIITGSTGVLSSATFTTYAGTISAIIAGDGGTLAKSTPGTVTLTRPNLYTGATTVTVGKLVIQDSLALGAIDGTTTVSIGATLQIDGTGLTVPEYISIISIGFNNIGALVNSTGSNSITGQITLAGSATINSNTGSTLTIATGGVTGAGNTLTIDGTGNTTFSTGPITTTTGALRKNGTGTLTISTFCPYTGATTVNRGTLTLNGNGSIAISASVAINSGSTMKLDNTSTVADRIGDAIGVTMNGGDLELYGSTSTNALDSAGLLTLNTGQNTISVFAAAGGSTILRFTSLTRTAGATGLFRGTSLGSTPAANVATLLFTTAPTLVGDDGVSGTPTVSIIEGIFGDNSTSGTGTDMVTYGRGNNNGVRLLNGAGFSNEYTSDYLITNANVKLTTATAAATTQINSLILDSGASITNPGSAQTITFTTGNILNLQPSGLIAGANTTLAGGTAEFIIRTPQNLDISSLITTSGGLSKSGTGTLTFSTAKTYTGLTSINGGTLLYGINDAINSGAVTINDSTLDIATYNDTVGVVIVQGGTITGDTGELTATSIELRLSTVSAIIAGSTTVTVTSTNERVDATSILTRNNKYTGTTTVTTGILQLGGAGDATNTPLGTTGGTTTVTSGAALDLNGNSLGTTEGLTISGTGIGSQATGSEGALINSHASAVTYQGAIALGAAARIGANYGKITVSGGISGASALTVGGFGDIDLTGVLSTITTVTKDGFGTYSPTNGNSTYAGATTISAGTLKLGGISVGGTNSPLGTNVGATAVTAGATLDLNGNSLGIAEAITNLNGGGSGTGDFASGALINSSGSSAAWTGTITIAAASGGANSTIKANAGAITVSAITGAQLLVLGGTGTGTVSGVFGAGAASLAKIDTGSWTMSAVNTFTSTAIIYQGTILAGIADAAGGGPLGTVAGATTVYSGGVFDMNGFDLNALAEGITLNGFGIANGGAFINNSGSGKIYLGVITLGSDARFTNSGVGTMTLSGGGGGAFERRFGGAGDFNINTAAISAGTVWKDGAGSLNHNFAMTYTGNTTVLAGTLNELVLNALSSGNLIVAGGTFDMVSNTADTIGALWLIDGTVATSGGASAILTTTSNTIESGTISGVIAGAVTTTKNTAGTVSITGAITASGAMTINAGSVTFSGANGSAANITAATVNLGGTLAVDNTSANLGTRLSNSLVVTMNGGAFNYTGSSSAAASETISQLAYATGHNVVTVSPGTGGSTTLTVGNATCFNRSAGATVLYRGTSLGSTPAANVSTLVCTNAPTVLGGGGASGSTTISILRGSFGDDSLTGSGTDMVTHNVGNTNGLRLLNGPGFSGEYVTNGFGTANGNVKITSNTAAATQNVNSIVINGGDVTNPGSTQTITTSGAALAGNVLIASANNFAGSNTVVALTAATELSTLATAATTITALIGNSTTGIGVFSGSGNITVSAAQTYTGTTYINNGHTLLTSATLTEGTAGALSTGGVTVVGGTFDTNGNTESVGAITITGGVVKSDSSTLTTTGTLATVANANLSAKVTGTVALPAAAVLNIADGLVEDDAVISAVLTSASTSLTKSTGTGVVVFSGDNTYAGSTTITTGTIKLGANGGVTNTPLGTAVGASTVGATGGALDLNGYSLGTAEGLTLNGTGVSTGGALANTSSTAVTYTGTITLGSATSIYANYGDINLTSTGSVTGAFALTLRGAGNGSFAGVLANVASSIVKNDLGTWTVSGASQYTGVTTITAGVFKLGGAGSGANSPLGTVGSATTVSSPAVLDLGGYSLATAEPITLNGTGIASSGALYNNSGSSTTITAVITQGATASRAVNAGTGTLNLNGNIGTGAAVAMTLVTIGDITQGSGSIWSGTLPLTKEGSGVLTLSGQNTSASAITVSTGTLRLGANGGAANTNLGTIAGATIVSAGAVLDLSTITLGGASTWEPITLNGSGLKNGGALLSTAAGNNSFGIVTFGSNARVVNNGAGIINFVGAPTGTFNYIFDGTGPTTISGIMPAVAITITKFGSGTLNLSAAHTQTGLIRINAGTVKYGVANAILVNAVTVAGGTLDINGQTDAVGAITVLSGTITNTGAAATLTGTAYTFESGAISTPLGGTTIAMAKNTGGSVTMNATLTNTGTLTINAGTTQYLTSNVLNAAITVTGGTLDIGANSDTVGTVTLTSGSIIGSTGVLTSSGAYAVASGTVSAILAGAVGVTKTTTGTVTPSGVNTYTGVTTIGGGILSVGTIGNGSAGGSNIGNASNDRANIVSSTGTGTLQYTGSTSSTDRNITGTNGITLNFDITNPATALTISGIITNSAGVATTAPVFKHGPGTLILSGANLHTGLTTVLAGTLKEGIANTLSTGAVTVTNGTFDLNNFSDSVGTVTLTNGGQIIDSGGTTAALTSTATFALQSGKVSAELQSSVASGISKTTTDRVILSGDNVFTSTSIALSAGALNLQHNNALGASGTSLTLTVTAGAVLETQNTITVPSTKIFTINGTGVNAGGAIENVADSNTLAGAITLGATGVRINSNSGTLTLSGAMSGSGNSITFGGAGNVTYDGVIGTVAGTLTKDGSGTLRLTNANTYQGATAIDAGIVDIQNATSLGTTAGGVVVADGATLQGSVFLTVGVEALTLNGSGVGNVGALNTSVDGLTWQGAVTLASNTSIGAAGSTTTTVSGTITGAGSIGLTKVGAGNVSIATTTLGGNLTISAGTLIASGASAISVGGDWVNSGTFTANSSTVTLNGTAQQAVSGTNSGATGKFNALTITNAFGDGSTTWSVTFAGNTETAATFTAVTASTKLRFNAGSTYTFQNISFNGQASGTKVFLRSSSGGSAWNLTVAGTRSVSFTDVKDSDATASGTAIDATDGTNTDSTGNTNWSFTLGITVSGGCFTDAAEGTPCTDDGSDQIKVAWNGTLNSGVDAVVDGAWSFTLSGSPVNGDILVFFRDGEATAAEEATTVVKYDGTGNVTNVKMYQSQLVIGTDSGSTNTDQTISVADLDTASNGYENSDDEDVLYDVTAGADLTVDADADKTERLYVMNGETFRPASGGGSDTTTNHLEIDATATMTADSNAINVAGDFTNAGTFTADTSTLTMNGTGTLTSNGNTINNFATSGGGTITLASATHTFAGDVTLGSTGLTAGTSTVVMTGTKNLVGGGQTLNNLTVDGTNTTVSLITSDLTVSGALTIGTASDGDNDTLSLAASRVLRLSANSGTNLVLNDTSGGTNTISGAGILQYENSATVFPTTGVISSVLRIATTNNNMNIPARTFTGDVVCYEVAGFSCILGTAGSQTLTFSSNLTLTNISTGITLDGNTYNPVVNVTGNVTVVDADASTSTISMGSGTWTVAGNFDLSNLNVLNHNSGALAMTGTSKSVTSNAKTLNNLVPSGTITNVGALTLAGTYNQTAGTFTHAANTTMTVTGTSFTIANGATWTKTSGTGILIIDNVTNLDFTDNNGTKQDMGALQIGASPGTTTLRTDLSATTVTIPTGDTFKTKGWDVTTTGAFDCQGTCALDLTDTAPNNETDGTIIDVGGDFTMSSSATFTAHTASKVYLNSTAGTDTNRTFTTGGKAYNDVELKNAGATNDDITISGTPFDINGVLTLTDGQVRLDTNDPNITTAGNLSINANATVTKADNGTATWTFDGSGTSTWTDGTGSGGQDLGLVTISGTTKTINLGSSAKATKLIIAASQTFGLGSSAYTFTLTGSGLSPNHPLQNSGTLNEGSSSTVKFTGTSDSDIDPESYNNLNVSPSGAGSPTFTVDVAETGNPIDVTGSLVIGDATNAVTLTIGAFSILTVGNDFTINSSGTFNGPSENAIVIGGSYTNNGTFVDAAGVDFSATSTGKTLAGSMTGANKFAAIYFSGSGGEWTNTSALEAGGLTMGAGSFIGTNNVTVNGGVGGAAGVINRTGGTFTVNPGGGSSFGPSTASTAWTFNNLTFTTSSGSQITNTVTSCATCTITVNGAMSVDTKVTLSIASSLWTVVGSLTTTTSGAITTTGTPTVTVQGAAIGGGTGKIVFYNLTKSGAGSTSWTGSGENAVKNTLTISAGTLVAPSGRLTVGTVNQTGGTFTHNSGTLLVNSTSNQTVTLTSNANSVVLNDGLVGYWNFDETSGTNAADSSGYGYDGTHSGTPTIDSDVPSVSFTNPRSLSFNGTSQYVDMATPEWLMNQWTDKISLSAWVKPTALSGDHVIVGQSENSSHNSPYYSWNIFQSGSQVCFRVDSTNICSASSTLTTGWQNIIGVYDGANMYLYHNGTQVATTAKTGNVTTGTQNIRVGARHTSSMAEYFSGKIDDVRVYRRNLSGGEVTALSGGDLGTISAATYTLGNALTVAGNLSLVGGTLDVATGLDYAVNVAGNWTNIGGAFTPRSGTVTLNGTASGKTITSRQQAFNLLTMNGSGGAWTVQDATTVSNNLTLTTGTFTGPSGILSVGGDFNNAATFTHNSGTVTMTGTSKNITGASATTFNNLTISGTTGIDAAGSDATVVSLLTVDNTKTLTINTGRTVTLSGTSGTTLSLVGTVTGAGRLTYKNNATAFPATGTISSILRMDATAGAQTIGGTNSATRTFGGLVEIYSNSAGTAKTVTLENGTARTFAFSGALNIIADNTQDLTLTADTATDPTVTVTGNVDFTGTGGGSEILVAGSGTWTVSGDVNFTGGTYTATTGNKLVMNGTSKTLTSASQSLYDFEVSAGTVAIADATTISNDAILSGGVLTGPSALTLSVGRNWTKTSGSYTANTGTVALTTSTSATISGSNTFYNLSVTGIGAAKTVLTVAATTQTVAGTWTVTGSAGQLVTIDAASAAQWNVNPTAASLDYVDISYTNNQGSAICATHAQSTNGNNTAITVTAGASCGITISGVIRQSSNETSAYDCSANTLTIGATVNGGTSATADCTLNTGVYSINAANSPSSAGDPVVVYINNGETPIGTTVTLAVDTSSNITNLDIIDGRVVTTYENAGPLTNAKMATGDNGNAGIRYAVATGNLTTESGIELHVKSGKTFTPGGTVTTTATGTAAGPAGDLHIAGTLTMGTNALTVGGDYNNAGTFNKTNTQTTTLAATGTGFTITPGTGDMNNLTVSGDAGGNGTYTLSGADLNVDGILNVNTGDTLAIDTSRTLTNSGSTEASLGGTINGAGTLRFVNGSGGPGTGGTISTIVRYDATSGDIASGTFDARTYGGVVEPYANSTSARTVTMASGTYTTSGSSSSFTPNAVNTGDLLIDASTNNPTVVIGGDLDFTGTGTGTELIAAGSGTWTVGGNVNLTSGFYAPLIQTLSPTWDGSTQDFQDKQDDGFGGCEPQTDTYSCISSSNTTLSIRGVAVACPGSETNYRSGLKFSTSSIPDTATIVEAKLNVNVATASSDYVNIIHIISTTFDGASCSANSALWDYMSGNYTYVQPTWSSTGLTTADLGYTAAADLQAILTASDVLPLGISGTGQDVVINSVDNSGAKPKLWIGYAATATSPTLVMNGTSKTLTTADNAIYNLTLSGTITLANENHVISNNLDLTGGTVTPGTSTVTMTGTSSTLTGSGTGSLYKLTIFPSSTGTATLAAGGGDLTVSDVLYVDTGDALSLGSGRTLTLSGSSGIILTLNGTVSGSGRLTYKSSTAFPTAGTISSTLRFDATSAASQIISSRTYGGPVEIYNNSGGAKTVASNSGTMAFSSTLDLSVGSGTVTLDLNSTDPTTTTVTGATTIGTGATLSAPSSNGMSINGNYMNNGTFTDNSGTVTLAGGALQTLSGTMTGSSDFNNLTVTNSTSTGDPDSDASTPSVSFAAAASAAGTFTASTANSMIRFNAGSTYTFVNVTVNGGAVGTRVHLRSSTGGTQWNLTSTGAQTVANTNVRDSYACGGDTVDASDGTSFDATKNDCWLINTLSLTISDTTIGFGSCVASAARYATGDTLGSSSDSADAHTITVATNARSGYSLTAAGSTLTSSAGTITALGGSALASNAGSEQFGLRSIKNSGTGTVSSPFDTANWAFTAGSTQPVASYGGASSSYSAVYGLRYLCNVSAITEPGSYTTDLTYILTPTF